MIGREKQVIFLFLIQYIYIYIIYKTAQNVPFRMESFLSLKHHSMLRIGPRYTYCIYSVELNVFFALIKTVSSTATPGFNSICPASTATRPASTATPGERSCSGPTAATAAGDSQQQQHAAVRRHSGRQCTPAAVSHNLYCHGSSRDTCNVGNRSTATTTQATTAASFRTRDEGKQETKIAAFLGQRNAQKQQITGDPSNTWRYPASRRQRQRTKHTWTGAEIQRPTNTTTHVSVPPSRSKQSYLSFVF